MDSTRHRFSARFKSTLALVCAVNVVLGCASSSSPSRDSSSGRLAPGIIQAETRRHYGGFRTCYERGLARDPKLAGRVQFRFIITSAGDVESASDAGSELSDPEVVSCIIREVVTIKFPKPTGGNVTVVYPVMFQPG